MNKRWRTFWIVSAAVAGIGTVFLILGIVMGASIREIRMRFPNGIGFHSEVRKETGGELLPREMTEYDGVRSLEIETAYMDVNIIPTERERICVETEEHHNLRVRRNGDKLKIESVEKNHHIKYEGVVNIYIPYNVQLTEAAVSVGAGRLNMDLGNAGLGQADISVGAGRADISNIEADEINIDCGAGRVTADGIKSRDLGVECGMGSMELFVAGEKGDYNYMVECGMGSVTIGDDSYGGLGREKKTNNGKSRNMEIECGMGSVTVNFE